LTCRPGPARVG